MPPRRLVPVVDVSVDGAADAAAGAAPAELFAHRRPRADDLAQLRFVTAIFLGEFGAEDDCLRAPDLSAVDALRLIACRRLERPLVASSRPWPWSRSAPAGRQSCRAQLPSWPRSWIQERLAHRPTPVPRASSRGRQRNSHGDPQMDVLLPSGRFHTVASGFASAQRTIGRAALCGETSAPVNRAWRAQCMRLEASRSCSRRWRHAGETPNRLQTHSALPRKQGGSEVKSERASSG